MHVAYVHIWSEAAGSPLQAHEEVLEDVTLHRQALTALPGVRLAPEALGIALLPKARQPDEPISDFEIQAVQQSTVDLLAIVSSVPLAAYFVLQVV